MAYVSNYPQAPFDAVMPAGPQEIVLWIAAIALGAFVLLSLAMCVKHRTGLPLLFLVAGFCTILLEPMVTHMGHAIHPEIGQISLFKTNDRAIPWHIATIYAFYFGGVFMFMFSRIRDGGFTREFVWKSYFFTCALAYVIEIVPVHIGLWVYYEPQALWVWKGGMPLFWTFVNAGCIYMALTMIKLFYPVLRGWKEVFVVPIAAMGAIMGHFGAGYLYYNAANSAAPQWLVEASGIGSVGLALTVVWLCSRLLAANTTEIFGAVTSAPSSRQPAPARSRSRSAPPSAVPTN